MKNTWHKQVFYEMDGFNLSKWRVSFPTKHVEEVSMNLTYSENHTKSGLIEVEGIC